ncbi:hypothetical protein AADL94_05545 [Escherichia coli]
MNGYAYSAVAKKLYSNPLDRLIVCRFAEDQGHDTHFVLFNETELIAMARYCGVEVSKLVFRLQCGVPPYSLVFAGQAKTAPMKTLDRTAKWLVSEYNENEIIFIFRFCPSKLNDMGDL